MIKGKSKEENGTITAQKHNGAKGQLEKSGGERSRIITGEGRCRMQMDSKILKVRAAIKKSNKMKEK